MRPTGGMGATALAVMLLTVSLSPFAPVQAGSSEPTPNPLPGARGYTAAIWDGTHAFLIGGYNASGKIAEILRYNPAGDNAVLNASVSPARLGASAVWAAPYVYIFGGQGAGYLNDTLRYDPTTGQVSDTFHGLLSARDGTAAIWTGQEAYIFGAGGGNTNNQVLRYTTNAVPQPVATLLHGGYGMAAVWNGSKAFVFGGSSLDKRIQIFDPATGQVTAAQDQLPSGRLLLSAVWTGNVALLFGGCTDPGCGTGTRLNEVLAYNPETDKLTTLLLPLNKAMCCHSAVWTGTDAYVFGGFDGTYLNQVLRYFPGKAPEPSIVVEGDAECVGGRAERSVNATASSDPDGDAIAFAWSSPGIAFDNPSAAVAIASFPLGTTTVTSTLSDGVFANTTLREVEVIDSIAPVTSADASGTPGSGGWWVAPSVQVTLAVEEACGVEDTWFSIDGGAVQDYAGSFDVEGDGVHMVKYWSSDIGGNLEPDPETEVMIDTVPPSTTNATECINGNAGWCLSTVAVTLSCTDETSGCDEIRYAIDGGSELVYDDPFPVEGEGLHTVTYYAIDVAGNAEDPQELDLQIDLAAPLVSFLNPVPGTLYVADVPVLTGQLPDTIITGRKTVEQLGSDTTTGSGVERVEFWVEGELRSIDTEEPYLFHWEAGKERAHPKKVSRTIEGRAYDIAGRMTPVELPVVVLPSSPQAFDLEGLMDDGHSGRDADDLCSGYATPSVGLPAAGDFGFLRVGFDDPADHWHVPVSGAGPLTLTMTPASDTDPALAVNYDLQVLTPDCVPFLTSDQPGSAAESLTFSPPAGAAYVVARVYVPEPLPGVPVPLASLPGPAEDSNHSCHPHCYRLRAQVAAG